MAGVAAWAKPGLLTPSTRRLLQKRRRLAAESNNAIPTVMRPSSSPMQHTCYCRFLPNSSHSRAPALCLKMQRVTDLAPHTRNCASTKAAVAHDQRMGAFATCKEAGKMKGRDKGNTMSMLAPPNPTCHRCLHLMRRHDLLSFVLSSLPLSRVRRCLIPAAKQSRPRRLAATAWPASRAPRRRHHCSASLPAVRPA